MHSSLPIAPALSPSGEMPSAEGGRTMFVEPFGLHSGDILGYFKEIAVEIVTFFGSELFFLWKFIKFVPECDVIKKSRQSQIELGQ